MWVLVKSLGGITSASEITKLDPVFWYWYTVLTHPLINWLWASKLFLFFMDSLLNTPGVSTK